MRTRFAKLDVPPPLLIPDTTNGYWDLRSEWQTEADTGYVYVQPERSSEPYKMYLSSRNAISRTSYGLRFQYGGLIGYKSGEASSFLPLSNLVWGVVGVAFRIHAFPSSNYVMIYRGGYRSLGIRLESSGIAKAGYLSGNGWGASFGAAFEIPLELEKFYSFIVRVDGNTKKVRLYVNGAFTAEADLSSSAWGMTICDPTLSGGAQGAYFNKTNYNDSIANTADWTLHSFWGTSTRDARVSALTEARIRGNYVHENAVFRS